MNILCFVLSLLGLLAVVRAEGGGGGGDEEPATPSPPTPVPPTPVPPTCGVCAGASSLKCMDDGITQDCSCDINGQEFTCTYSTCCLEPDECCESGQQEYMCQAGACQCMGPMPYADSIVTPPHTIPQPTPCTSYSTCCPDFPREGRSLKGSAVQKVRAGDGAIQQFKEACGSFVYTIWLYVESGHLYSAISPTEEAAAVGCPHVAVHAVFDSKSARQAEKEVLFYSDVPGFINEVRHLDNRMASELVDAIEEVDVSGPGAFDFLTNNCAEFQLNMASKLGLKVDKEIVSFVARRVLEDSGASFVNNLRKSVSFDSFFGHRKLAADALDDEDLLELVAHERAARSELLM